MHWSVHLVIRIGVSFLRDILLCGLEASLAGGLWEERSRRAFPLFGRSVDCGPYKNNNNISKELNCILKTSIRRQNCPIITGPDP